MKVSPFAVCFVLLALHGAAAKQQGGGHHGGARAMASTSEQSVPASQLPHAAATITAVGYVLAAAKRGALDSTANTDIFMEDPSYPQEQRQQYVQEQEDDEDDDQEERQESSERLLFPSCGLDRLPTGFMRGASTHSLEKEIEALKKIGATHSRTYVQWRYGTYLLSLCLL
jgi:hypothetical protein